jgi:hypothetical protein
MSDVSARLDLPFIAPSQAQKHVTYNEAVQRLDLLVQMVLDGFEATEPPAAPETGARYALGQGAMGVWAGQDGQIAVFLGEAWGFVAPQEGWIATARGSADLRLYRDGTWRSIPERVERLGIATDADTLNRLSVAAEATLLTHAGAGHQLKINKAEAGATASLLFQTGFAGRAEMGTAGQDDFSIKVTADGVNWTEALRVNAQTGRLSGAALQSSAHDTTPGRVLTVGAQGAALGADVYRKANILGTVSMSGSVPTGAVIERGSNANGRYIRFADGTQICTGTLTSDGAAETVWTYPAVFAGVDGLAITPTIGAPRFGNPTTIGVSNASLTFNNWTVGGIRSSVSTRLFALGRWS